MAKLIRLTLNKLHPTPFLVEYGFKRELTPEEEDELEILHQELLEYSDFTTAQEIQDEKRQELMKKKQHLDELEAIKKGELDIIWKPQTDVSTILLMIRPEYVNIYVENLPGELFDKLLLDTHIHLNVTQALQPIQQEIDPKNIPKPQTTHGLDPQILEVIARINSIDGMSSEGLPWIDLVSITLENPAPGQQTLTNTVYVMPVKFLKKDWPAINTKIKEAYSNRQEWIRADKESHWRISF